MSNIDDIVDTHPIERQFKLDVLNGYDEEQWPGRIDYIAHRTAHGSYTIGIQSDTPHTISDGETLDKAASDYYLKGIANLTDTIRYRSALPDDFPLGQLLVQFADMRDGMVDVDQDELDPGEVLGRILTRNLKRSTTGEKAQLAERLSNDVQTPRALVSELCAVPEIAGTIESALPDHSYGQSLADQLANVDLTTQLWDHQFEALVKWLRHDQNGYVNMATATGKTVLGLAAVAHCIDAGSLHPADQDRLEDELSQAPDESESSRSDSKNVLIVTTDELLGVQWARLFQTHCHTPPEFTKVTNGSIRLPWGRIDIKSAGGLDNVDPSEYRLAIFDEVHNYTKSGGWGDGLRRFVDADCPVLALTGSVTEGLERVSREVETAFSNVFTYTHTEALEDGVIPDFEWTLTFADVDRDTSTLANLERTADLADGVVEYQSDGLSVQAEALTDAFDIGPMATGAISGEYETGTQLADAIRDVGDDDGVGPTPELESLASGLSNRSIYRLNLSTDHSAVVDLAEDALQRERPVLILTQSYDEAQTIWQALYDRHSDRVVKKIEQDATPAEQDETITTFDESDTDQKVLIGPGKHIGQGNDIQSVEVGINISRPGSGVNASLVQRLGRLLRGAGEKDRVEFYHVSGVQPAETVMEPDGESFIRNVTEFFSQVHTPGTDGIHKPPQVSIENDTVTADIVALEDAGAERILAEDQSTDIETAYASTIVERTDDSSPSVTTDWFDDAFGDVVMPDESNDTADTAKETGDSGQTVSVDPVILSIGRLRVQTSDRHDSLEDLIEEVLTPFLDEVVGNEAQISDDVFDVTSEHSLSFACNPALEVAIEAKVENMEGVESPDEFVRHAMVEWLGVDADDALHLPNYGQYEPNIEALLESDNCPCSTPGEIVQAALEVHFEL